ncbi:MAG: hypothetical protein WC788_09840 [Candidatus Paceibacterota bacterium]|jgi:hypothetical protein
MTPKIIFKYSWIYDQNWKKWIKVYIKKEDKNYPTTPEVLNYIKKVEKMWRKCEKKVLREMTELTGLKWKEKNITCYVVGNCSPFSDPLTIKTYKEHDYFIDTLVHESIHQLFTQEGNLEQAAKAWKYFEKKYANETYRTRIHIPLHAIHWHIFLKFFGQKRLDRQIEKMNKYTDYKKAWDIVKKEGYQNVIGRFNNF